MPLDTIMKRPSQTKPFPDTSPIPSKIYFSVILVCTPLSYNWSLLFMISTKILYIVRATSPDHLLLDFTTHIILYGAWGSVVVKALRY